MKTRLCKSFVQTNCGRSGVFHYLCSRYPINTHAFPTKFSACPERSMSPFGHKWCTVPSGLQVALDTVTGQFAPIKGRPRSDNATHTLFVTHSFILSQLSPAWSNRRLSLPMFYLHLAPCLAWRLDSHEGFLGVWKSDCGEFVAQPLILELWVAHELAEFKVLGYQPDCFVLLKQLISIEPSIKPMLNGSSVDSAVQHGSPKKDVECCVKCTCLLSNCITLKLLLIRTGKHWMAQTSWKNTVTIRGTTLGLGLYTLP